MHQIFISVSLGLLLTSVYSCYAALEQYSPYVDQPSIYPPNPTEYSDAFITVNVIDEFGKIDTALLLFSTNEGQSWNTVEMKLYYGSPSDGTYVGIIPPHKSDTEIYYKFYFSDDLGYSVEIDPRRFTVSEDSYEPFSGDVTPSHDQYHWETINVVYRVGDSGSGVSNVTMFYFIDDPKNITDVALTRISGDQYDGVYKGTLGEMKEGTVINLISYSFDNVGNYIAKNATYVVSYPQRTIDVYPTVTKIDLQELVATIEFYVVGQLPHEELFNTVLKINSTDSAGRIYSQFNIDVMNFSSSVDRRVVVEKSFLLIGNRANFPFDEEYSLNLDLLVTNDKAHVELHEPKFHVVNVRNAWAASGSVEPKDDSSGAMRISLQRNDLKVAEIAFVITFVFLILGSILLLDGDSKNLTNRLTISLGVLVFIFAFRPLIEVAKPSSYGGITVADFAIILAIIATFTYIVFPVLRSIFRSIYFDFLAFLIPIIFLIFLSSYWQLGFPWWFIPTVIFCLGYGLATRLFYNFRHRAQTKINGF